MSTPDSAALLERAAFQDIRYDERIEADYQQALVRDACAELGCDAASAARHWVRNRNADLWKIDTSAGTLLLKILTSKPIATLECEYEHLVALHDLATASGLFRVPRPRLLFPGRSAYIMEFVTFEPLVERLLSHTESAAASGTGLRACGRALGTIHEAWIEAPRAMDTAAVAADFRHLPWTPDKREAELFGKLLAGFAGASFPNARLYLDFDPVNVGFVPGETPVLLDPPERSAVDAIHWDLGVFLFGLQRAAWRRPLAARRHATRLPEMREAFIEGYADAASDPRESGGAALIGLAEFARLGQLWRWWLRPLGFRHRAIGFARAAYAWPLLRRARRQLMIQLEQLGQLEQGE